MPVGSRVRIHARREGSSFAWVVSEELAHELRPRLLSEGWVVTISPEQDDDPREEDGEPDAEYPAVEDSPPGPSSV